MNGSPVVLVRDAAYDPGFLTENLKKAFSVLGTEENFFAGKTVLLKANLVLAKKPEQAATTHPAVLRALCEILLEYGAKDVVLADSPGGPYSAAALNHVYKVTGMTNVHPALRLNDDFTFRPVVTDGAKLKNLDIISAALDADVIVDVCKFKSHELTGMSCAVKNLFGLIPGTQKFEMHNAFPNLADFAEMLVDLCSLIVSLKPFLAICDGILSMEGNGPTHGNPVETNFLLASRDPFALDVIAEHMMKRDGDVQFLTSSANRGLVPRDWREIPLFDTEGEAVKEPPVFPFALPDAEAGSFLRNLSSHLGGNFTKLFEPRPEILKKSCVGCGRCAESCPRRTITMETHRGRRLAHIHPENCIRCYCCQELCPIGAVGIHRNALIRLIH